MRTPWFVAGSIKNLEEGRKYNESGLGFEKGDHIS